MVAEISPQWQRRRMVIRNCYDNVKAMVLIFLFAAGLMLYMLAEWLLNALRDTLPPPRR